MKRIFLIFSIFLASTLCINCSLAANNSAKPIKKNITKMVCQRDAANPAGWRAMDLSGNRLRVKNNINDYRCKVKAKTLALTAQQKKFTFSSECSKQCVPGDAACGPNCYCHQHLVSGRIIGYCEGY